MISRQCVFPGQTENIVHKKCRRYISAEEHIVTMCEVANSVLMSHQTKQKTTNEG